MANWRAACRACSEPPVPGRGYCERHLAAVRRGGTVDLAEDFPTESQARQLRVPGKPVAFTRFPRRPVRR